MWVLNKFEYGHLSLNSHGNSHLAIDLLRETAVPFAESRQAAVLHQISHSPVNNLDSSELVRHVVAT